MTVMTDPDYVSVAPYRVVMSWVEDRRVITQDDIPDLRSALRWLYHPSAPIGEIGSPTVRKLVDSRDVVIRFWREANNFGLGVANDTTIEVAMAEMEAELGSM